MSIASSSVADAASADDRDPRDHHLVDAALAELDDRVDHLLLLGLEDALLAAALDDQAQLLGADLGLVRDVAAEQAGDRRASIPVRSAITGPSTRARKSIGSDSASANRSGSARASVFGTSSREDDREQGQDDRDDDQGDGRPRRPPRPAPASSVGQVRRQADRGERRGEEADDGQPELGDGEEPARVVEQAADAAGARAALVDELLDAAAADATRGRSRRRRRTPRAASGGR